MIRTLRRLLPNRHPLRLAWHKCKALAAAIRFGFPARHLHVIGITGTDGKTTTVGMIADILNAAGKKTGALSTAFFQVGTTREWNPTQKTSPSPFVVQRFLRRLVTEGCTHAVLEYSSHGLVQGRTQWTFPTVAGITNTAMEHLDYHGTMEQYRKDKSLLFQMLKGKGSKVLNAEDETSALYSSIPSSRTVIYATHETPNALLWLTNIDVTSPTPRATVHAREKGNPQTSDLRLAIPGTFNLENALCAIGCAMSCRCTLAQCTDALRTFNGVPGRMERIDEGQPFSVYIDFTVTPQAFEKTLTTLRKMIEPGKRILVLTGSCGDRMREKRPIVGKLCSEMADVVVITDDESYAEDPKKIIEEVWAGVDQSKTEAHKIFDRREAIEFILKQAKSGDAVLLCGLGSYPSRMTPKGPIPWNEQEITRESLKKMGF